MQLRPRRRLAARLLLLPPAFCAPLLLFLSSRLLLSLSSLLPLVPSSPPVLLPFLLLRALFAPVPLFLFVLLQAGQLLARPLCDRLRLSQRQRLLQQRRHRRCPLPPRRRL